MSGLNDVHKYSRYFVSFLPSEINIEKDDIFYRDKYNEIINYIKMILTNSEDLEVYKYIKPKGALLINVARGTDIIDYIKLICSNYYLEVIELNNSEIIKTPDDFFYSFNEILENFEKDKEEDKKKIILINQKYNFNKIFNDKSLLNNFINNVKDLLNDVKKC